MTGSTPTSDREAIDDLLVRWAEAIRNGDIDTLLELITEDAEFWTHGAAPLVGREAVANTFQMFFGLYRLNQRFEPKEIIVVDGWAFVRGTEINSLTPKDGTEMVEVRQRAFSVLRKDPDGKWRFARGMTNKEPVESQFQS